MDSSNTTVSQADVTLPRITIKYCTQCKWMLRAAYLAQELLSTFSTTLGEIALLPSTGGVFTVDITISTSSSTPDPTPTTSTPTARTTTTRLWDRKTNNGFPETKILKQLVRNVIDPARDLGHVDRDHRREKEGGRLGDGGGKLGDEVGVGIADAVEERDGVGKERCEDCA